MTDSPARVLHRLVKTNPPTLEDFMSNEALGKVPRRPLSPRGRDLWRGVLHYDSPDAAAVTGRDSPWHGADIAVVRIPANAGVRIGQTGRVRAHHTVWAKPADLLAWVVSVAPVERVH